RGSAHDGRHQHRSAHGVPVPTLRRDAATGAHRALPRLRSGPRADGRAHHCGRRGDAEADPRSGPRSAGAPRLRGRIRHPRSLAAAGDLRSHRDHLRRQVRRGGDSGPPAQPRQASVHPSSAQRLPPAVRTRTPPHGDPGLTPGPARSAHRLRLRAPLCRRDADLPHEDPRAPRHPRGTQRLLPDQRGARGAGGGGAAAHPERRRDHRRDPMSLADPTAQPGSDVTREPTASTVPVLEARDVHMHFSGTDSAGRPVTIRALDGVDLALHRGQICALVGESGSGKTTIARLFALIHRPTSGQLLFDGKPIRVRGGRAERAYYRHVQLIYQDPFASLNGLKKIRTIVSRVAKTHFPRLGRAKLRERTAELLEPANMTPSKRYLDRYPTDPSGGQRQRVATARALAGDPAVLLADEPTSMLDASIRLDVLNLRSELRRTEDVAVLYITHDIASARYLSDRIHVMYGGKVVEAGPTEAIIS